MSESGDATQVSTPHVADSEDFYGSESEEVILKTRDAPHQPITQKDIRSDRVLGREVQQDQRRGARARDKHKRCPHAYGHCNERKSRARKCTGVDQQTNEVDPGGPRAFHGGIRPSASTPVSTFVKSCAPTMETLEPARQTPICTLSQPRAPTMSTPISPPGAPPKFRSEFSFASPVNQATPAEPTRGDRDRDINERPTHENGNVIGGNTQLTMNKSTGLNNTATRHASSPKVPIFDGTVSAHFHPWLIQFEAIARHQCWTPGEKVVRLVASLTGPAANMLIGMIMGQLDEHALGCRRIELIEVSGAIIMHDDGVEFEWSKCGWGPGLWGVSLLVIAIPLLTIIGLELPTHRFVRQGRVRLWTSCPHVSKLITTEALDSGIVPTGPCLRAEPTILIRERSISWRWSVAICLSGNWAHLVSHPTC